MDLSPFPSRIEQEQQHQRAVLVHEELAIARFVALAADVVQPLQERPELAEILEALDVFLADRRWRVALSLCLSMGD